jgi:hypothetical protein
MVSKGIALAEAMGGVGMNSQQAHWHLQMGYSHNRYCGVSPFQSLVEL